MRKASTFEFDGETLTVRQIKERVPALCDASIRYHLAAGRNTKTAMLAFDATHANRANGRKASLRAKRSGQLPGIYTSRKGKRKG